jgi:hypothetical protein
MFRYLQPGFDPTRCRPRDCEFDVDATLANEAHPIRSGGHVSNSSVSGDDDLTAGAAVESGETIDSATADREAAFDDAVSSAAGNVTGEDAVVASPAEDSTVDETILEPDRDTSQAADVAAGYDDENPDRG